MFVFLPYATHELTYRRPWANYFLLAVTAAAFFVFGGMDHFALARSVRDHALGGRSGLGPLSYLFLHANLAHLIGNLVALWVFGNAICARVGNAVYLPLYLALGVLAGLSQQLFHDGLTVGASGAINGLVAMFLVVNPKARMSILVGWLLPPIFRSWTVRSFWLIGVWMIWDVVGALTSSGPVAYGAHLAGYLFGALFAFGGLRLGLVPLDDDERSLPDLLGWSRRRGPRPEPARAATVPDAPPAPRATPKPRLHPAPKPVLHRVAAAPEGLRRDPQFVTVTCACGERVETSRLFGLDGLRCPRCHAPLEAP